MTQNSQKSIFSGYHGDFAWSDGPKQVPASAEPPVGKIDSIKPDGTLGVTFQSLPYSYNGKTFEVCTTVGSILTSIGIGVIKFYGPGVYILIPGPSGISNPSIGDTVVVYNGDQLQLVNPPPFPSKG
jgi:hypothetical protein